MDIISNFHQLLNDVFKKSTDNFSGVGIIVYNNIDTLPITPLRNNNQIILPITDYNKVVDKLISISKLENRYHDGFHLLNNKLELTHLSQYVAAPIVRNLKIHLEEHGSRYRTALYSSKLPNVICSGVISVNYPITLFRDGQTIIY